MPLINPSNGISSSIAYSRWEPLSDQDDEEIGDRPATRLQEFQRQEPSNTNNAILSEGLGTSIRSSAYSILHPGERSIFRVPCTKGAKIMILMIIFGIGWIIGFLIRWSVHNFYIDPMGHCITPISYSYSPEMSKWVQESITSEGIKSSFLNFTKEPHHRAGSPESAAFVDRMMRMWENYGLDKVEIDLANVRVTKSSEKRPNKINVFDKNGTILWSKNLNPDEGDKIAFSANGAGRGTLVYGHYGRISDFYELQKQGLTFNNSVVLLKTSSKFDTGSMVRNAQIFGAKGAILFPDPNAYILTPEGRIGRVPSNTVMSHSVKFIPGDPSSLYIDSQSSIPEIPVISLSFDEASVLMRKYVNGHNVSRKFWFELPLMTNESRDFSAEMHVHNDFKEIRLQNVIGVIPGRYEPTRYVIIGCHHDTWYQGAAKPGLGHSILMQLVKSFGKMRKQGWSPGRSIIFTSWDGEELGSLGITSWINRHRMELSSRAVSYIDLDHLVSGSKTIHVHASPLLRNIVEEASKQVFLKSDNGDIDGTLHSLYKILINDEAYEPIMLDIPSVKNSRKSRQNAKVSKGWSADEDAQQQVYLAKSPFQSFLGVSSVEISIKNENGNDAYPYVKTMHDTPETVEKFLDPRFQNSVLVGKYVATITMILSTSKKLPMWVSDYAKEVSQESIKFFRTYAQVLKENELNVLSQLKSAISDFQSSSKQLHNNFRTRLPLLEFLEYHEFNDQLSEVERSFLMPRDFEIPNVIYSPYRHVIRGPSPLNSGKLETFPRLRASLELVLKTSLGSWDMVKREAFFVSEALKAATCVMDNHILLANARETQVLS
uniref:Nacetylated alphalinked acidic dipeptidase 2 [Falco cherrug] n=1 Tax=Lepeophtheirus salmonis TaxID=72036 RepID=A0A0K2UC67_LEPSM